MRCRNCCCIDCHQHRLRGTWHIFHAPATVHQCTSCGHSVSSNFPPCSPTQAWLLDGASIIVDARVCLVNMCAAVWHRQHRGLWLTCISNAAPQEVQYLPFSYLPMVTRVTCSVEPFVGWHGERHRHGSHTPPCRVPMHCRPQPSKMRPAVRAFPRLPCSAQCMEVCCDPTSTGPSVEHHHHCRHRSVASAEHPLHRDPAQ